MDMIKCNPFKQIKYTWFTCEKQNKIWYNSAFAIPDFKYVGSNALADH